jgi:rare lipoprotein A
MPKALGQERFWSDPEAADASTNQTKEFDLNTNLRTALIATATVAAFGASVAPSLAAYQPDAFDGVYARGSHAQMRHAAGHHHGGAKLTYYYQRGKLKLVNTDHNGGLDGVASVYHDRITANGEHMNPNAMTAAHKSLPMGSMVTVHNKRNGRSVTVRINDRGPYVTGRVIDLSPGAARVIGMDGLAPVSLSVAGRGGHHRFG